MERDPNFAEMLARGEVAQDDIDRFVQTWHAGGHPGLELHEFLGLSKEQYAAWLKDPDTDLRGSRCTTCGGTGGSRDIETNGMCWDCRGTGQAATPKPVDEDMFTPVGTWDRVREEASERPLQGDSE